jgi:hypothetical protein
MANRKSQPYNGHKSWNYWNVSLWINNTEGLYRMARKIMEDCKGKGGSLAAAGILADMLPEKTPDGARYTKAAIREAIKDILS